MKYKGIVFDLDGVICSTDQYHYLAWKVVADRVGAKFDETINNRLRGVSRMDSLEIILENYHGPALSIDDKEKLAAEKNEIYREQLKKMSHVDLNPAIQDMLIDLKNAGYKMAIGSSSKNTPLILHQIGLDGFFDAVADGNQVTHSKPDPEVFLLAARLLGLPPSECLVVEDAKAGIEAARRGGFDSAGVGDAAGAPGVTLPLGAVTDLAGYLL